MEALAAHANVEALSGSASPFWSQNLLPAPFHTVFTTRIAGTSSGPYASLNLALHVGDDPRRVRENRRLFFEGFLLNPASAVTAQQVHGSSAAIVDDSDAGRGCFSHGDALPGCDGLVTRAARLPLLAFSADCLLVALGDPVAKTLAVVHAGWRGLADGIIENTLTQMRDAGADLSRVHASGAPSIGPCCFEVGPEVVNAVGAQFARPSDNGKAMLDLREAARERLVKAGVSAEHIQIDPTCTCCRADLFFSHRRSTKSGEKQTGRMAMLAWIE